MVEDLAALNRQLVDITETLALRCESLQRHAQELGSGMDDAWDTAPLEAAKTVIGQCRTYTTPEKIIDFVAGSGNYLVDSIIGNPPYES
jgi:hypothetical protein